MNYAQTYKDTKMKDESFRKAYMEEKLKLDLEFMLEDLSNKIKLEKSYNELMRGVQKIKRALYSA